MIVENAGHVLEYNANSSKDLMSGDRLTELTFDNVRFTGLNRSSLVRGAADEPLTVRMKNVTAEFETGPGELFSDKSENIVITVE